MSEINLKLGCEKLKAYTESLFLQKILKLAYQPQKDYSKPAYYAKKMLYPNSNRCLQEAAWVTKQVANSKIFCIHYS